MINCLKTSCVYFGYEFSINIIVMNISIRLTSLALWQSNDCPSASKATLMNMDKYFMWIHYERLHNHNKAKHNKTVCIFLGIYCIQTSSFSHRWQRLPFMRKQHWIRYSFATRYHVSQCWPRYMSTYGVTRSQNVTPVKCGVVVADETYLKTSNIRRASVGNKIVDHSDEVGALPVCVAPTISSSST